LNAGPHDPPSGVLAFTVHYSTGEPVQPGQAVINSFGLRGQGRLLIDEQHFTFEGERHDGRGGPPRMVRAEVANVDYNAASGAFVLRTRNSDDFVVFWTVSRADAEAIWNLLPHEKTPEFVAEEKHHRRFSQAMSEIGGRAPVTPVLIALNAAMFIVMLLAGANFVRPDSELLIRLGSNYGPLTWGGEWWRLLSSTFLHAGIVHIALNMFALYQGGVWVERLYGSARFALLYLLSGLAGSVASVWWEPARNSVGASGAIFGVYGALLVFFALRRADFPASLVKSIGSSALLFCGYSLAVGAAHPSIDNTAHIGGLLGGIVSGLLLVRPFSADARKQPQPLRLLAAALAVLLPLAWLAGPLAQGDDPRLHEARFVEAVRAFAPRETELRAKMFQLLEVPADVRVDRLALADRLQDEVLEPWSTAIQPVLDVPAVPAGSRSSAFQPLFRDYLLAMRESMSRRIDALREGDAASSERAAAADQKVVSLLERLSALNETGTPEPEPRSQAP
jgi:rhomboid protease GluP